MYHCYLSRIPHVHQRGTCLDKINKYKPTITVDTSTK